MLSSAAAFFCICIVAVYSTEEEISSKAKRDVSGLYPFPRVGRGNSAWIKQQFVEPQEVRRNGLIPFPRVGRGPVDQCTGKRDVQGSGGGMWFGPRLGRLQKREIPKSAGWALVQIKDFPAKAQLKENFAPRLGRDSSEDTYHNKDYESEVPEVL